MQPIGSPIIGAGRSNKPMKKKTKPKYNKKTLKIIADLESEEFKSGVLSMGAIVRRYKVTDDRVRYHKYRLYHPDKFAQRYLLRYEMRKQSRHTS